MTSYQSATVSIYSSILYRFPVTWRWRMSWPWTLGYGSFKVIGNGAIR